MGCGGRLVRVQLHLCLRQPLGDRARDHDFALSGDCCGRHGVRLAFPLWGHWLGHLLDEDLSFPETVVSLHRLHPRHRGEVCSSAAKKCRQIRFFAFRGRLLRRAVEDSYTSIGKDVHVEILLVLSKRKRKGMHVEDVLEDL